MTMDSDDLRFGLEAGENSLNPPAESLASNPRQETDPKNQNCGRYRIISFLGRGGMGVVYKAQDPILHRFVALKLLHGSDPEQANRFLQEARSQARVDHQHVCKVYETGVADGKPYIAMQYIAGRTFDRAIVEMSLEQKLQIVIQVAEGLHAAHRTGLIHRDIKPGNILVEKTEDGEWKPYVLDFGLARETAGDGLTMTGTVVGTPMYMAPEQVRGEIRSLDRRTDIYSLGGTLYTALAGHPPYPGQTAGELLVQVLLSEPKPLRKVNPRLPPDLETIVMKCLEREPQQRYDSCRSLADDLRRYLDGEPIAARRAGWAYKLLKKAKKHLALVTVSSLAMVGLALLGTMWLHSRWQGRQQAEMARLFGQEVKEVETALRFGALLPLHDIDRERKIARLGMKTIEAQIQRFGPLGQAPGHYVLGRACLAMHDYEQARSHLEKARRLGFRDPGLDFAQGRVMGEMYRRALAEARLSGAKDPARLRQIEQEYRDPALRYLRDSQGARMEGSTYTEGLIAFYEKRYPDALKKANESFGQIPWFFEARELEGDIYMVWAWDKAQTGDYDGAMRDFDRAGAAYAAAADMARSDGTAYLEDGYRWIRVMEIEVFQGRSPENAFTAAIAAVEKAGRADPANPDVHIRRAYACWRWGEYLASRGQDPGQVFQQAIESGQKALELDPGNALALHNLGTVFLQMAIDAISRGADPRPAFARTFECFQRSIRLNPALEVSFNNLGYAYQIRGEYEIVQGLDPRKSMALAIDNYRQVTRLNSRYLLAYNNLGLTYVRLGEFGLRSGADPREPLEKALQAYNTALGINPNFAPTRLNLGNAFWVKAEYERMVRADPLAAYRRAADNYRQALRVNPNYAEAHITLAFARLGEADYLLEQGRDPAESLAEARQALREASRLNPRQVWAPLKEGEAFLVEARWNARQGRSPGPFLAKADAAVELARRINPRDSSVYALAAEIDRWRADDLLSKRQVPREVVAHGLFMAGKSLSLDPTVAEVILVRGVLYLFQARMAADPSQPAQQALMSFETACRINPLLKTECAPWLAEAAQWRARTARRAAGSNP